MCAPKACPPSPPAAAALTGDLAAVSVFVLSWSSVASQPSSLVLGCAQAVPPAPSMARPAALLPALRLEKRRIPLRRCLFQSSLSCRSSLLLRATALLLCTLTEQS